MNTLSDISILYLAILQLNDPITYKANRLTLARYLIAAQDFSKYEFFLDTDALKLDRPIPYKNILNFANAMTTDKKNGLLDKNCNFNTNIKNKDTITLKSEVLTLQIKDWGNLTVDQIDNIFNMIQKKKSR